MNVPKLRFKEFSGEWAVKCLGDIALTVTSGSRDWAQYYSSSGSKFIRMTNLSREGVDLKLDDLKYVDIASDSSDGKRTSLIEGDILISITAELGKIGWVPPNFGEAFINQHTALVRINSKESDSKFTAYLLATQKMNKAINSLNDAGAKAGLNLPTIKKFTLNLPSIPEQTKIASFLTAIDEKIAQLTQKHELLSQYKKGVMQQIFSQQLRFKDDNGEEFGDWEEIEIGEVVAYEQPQKYLVSSTEYNNLFRTPVLTAGKTFILGYTDETTGIYDATKNNVIIFDDFTTAYKFVNFSFKAKSSAMKILKPIDKEKTNIKFIFEAMSEVNFSLGDEHKRRWISEYSKEIIQYPSLPEQTKIANFLSSIDQKIGQAAAQLDAAKHYKRGLLQQMFV